MVGTLVFPKKSRIDYFDIQLYASLVSTTREGKHESSFSNCQSTRCYNEVNEHSPMETTKKKAKPCEDHFLIMPDKAERYFMYCDKCGFKLPSGDTFRSVKFENRYFFDH